jgi:FkbM family methyltransferase
MQTVHYVDIGLHTQAEEIAMMQQACSGLCHLQIHGIEANPQFILDLRKKFEDQPNIKIHCYAIADKVSEQKLYLSPSSNYHGNSIFADKNNVTSDYVKTVGVPFSLLVDAGIIKLGAINVLRYNIEGAEYHLVKDLIANQMHPMFQIICGATPDMHKVASLKHLERTHVAGMKAFGINRMNFYHSVRPEQTTAMIENMRNEIKSLLQ